MKSASASSGAKRITISEKRTCLELLARTISSLQEAKRNDLQSIFEALAARLEASNERGKKIERGMKIGWAHDELTVASDAQLDWMVKKLPAGRHSGKPVPGLVRVRKRLGLTQEKLAEKCGAQLWTIQRGERGGNWSVKTIKSVAHNLKIDTSKIPF